MASVKDSKTKPSASEFTLGRELGQGNFSRVFLATHNATKEVFAVKLIEKARIMRMKIRHPNIFNEVNMEKTVLNMLRHPNIVRMYHTFQDAANLYFLMEYVSNGELWDVLQLQGKQVGCTEGLARFYAADIVNALEYMASRHIVHRFASFVDLKPENMIVAKEDGHVRIVDFGTAKNLSDISLNGPNFYMSPETIDNKSVDCKSDLWSLGCILFQLLAGETPFHGGSAYLTFLRVKAGTFHLPAFFSDDAKDLITQLLHPQPHARPSFEAIKAHPFFYGVDFAHHMTASPPEPTSEDQFVAKSAADIAAYVAAPSTSPPQVLATASGLPPVTKARLMHVLHRMQLLAHHPLNLEGHDGAQRELDHFERVLATVNDLRPTFVVFSGNMTSPVTTNDVAAAGDDDQLDHKTSSTCKMTGLFQAAVHRTLDPTIRVVTILQRCIKPSPLTTCGLGTPVQVFVPGELSSETATSSHGAFGDDFYSFWYE
ncbi:hypothetical protein DYB30_004876 [Aphanomyces astaci]|uniref:Protein kinase domain-containing protein n=1 Tax=Aphanomyces astaci TaxID=112090 RepID=A0A397D9E8_APHAT|nr:hypothetical protein DYB30_004876 [Aphanomyces astaci]